MAGLNINSGLLMMQYRSGVVNSMLNGGSLSSLSSLNLSGTARSQASLFNRQLSASENVASYIGRYNSSSDSSSDSSSIYNGGTARQQALAQKYDTFTRTTNLDEEDE